VSEGAVPEEIGDPNEHWKPRSASRLLKAFVIMYFWLN
jgi:hypothetical protein